MNAFEKSMKGNAPEFRALLRSAQIVAATDVTVLLLGESGTGKELLARAIHSESHRNSAPFVAINCAALPEALAESELFGHRRGAFTGAVNHNPGRIRCAEGGTLFLDEVGELPLNIQAKLLRFLESGECQPVGEGAPVHTNVRVIAATHRDLRQQVQLGTFREDLYYRLNVVPLELPPLCLRSDDIPMLIEHISSEMATQYGLAKPHFSSETLTVLRNYRWPGNVRELRNFCERMVVLLAGREVYPENLPHEMRSVAALDSTPFTLPESGISLEELEQSLIRQALDKSRGNRSRAARLLGLTRDTLLYRLKKYAIG
jgi:DNA-binding NtrC family response regulator